MMKYKGYAGRVEFDPQANILHGEVIGIRDVVTFQGKSVQEVEQAFKDSVDDYLRFCEQRGEEPDRPFSGNFVVRINSDLHRRASMLASASGKSLNTWIAECLSREVANGTRARKRSTSRSSKTFKRSKNARRAPRA